MRSVVASPRESGVVFGLLALAMAAAAGCTREPPAASPRPPDASAPDPAPAELSHFSVPLEYDFTNVLALVERNVPKSFGSIDSVREVPDDPRRHYAFQATRGPFSAFADGDELHLRATVAYTARGYYKPPLAPTLSAGCGSGDERPRLAVELATPLSLSGDWHLVSHARVVRVAPASAAPRDHCDVSILHRDVTASVVDAARTALTAQLGDIDRKIGAVDLSTHVKEWWEMLSSPIKLADGVWLVLGPERLRVGHARGRRRVLTVPVSLDARPRIVTGNAEPAVRTTGIPALSRDTGRVQGFHVVLDGLVDYGTASRQLSSALEGKHFTGSGHVATLRRVTVMPQPKGQLAIAFTFAGGADGVLQLAGTPLIDRFHGSIVVPDLDFDLRTDSRMLTTYAWLRSDDLRAELRRRTQISTEPALAKARAMLLEGLNRKLGDAVTLSGVVDSVSVRGLFVTRDGLVVRAEASGRAGMSVRQQ